MIILQDLARELHENIALCYSYKEQARKSHLIVHEKMIYYKDII